MKGGKSMKILKSKPWIVVTFSLALIIVFCVTYSTAQERIKVSGKLTTADTIRHEIACDDTDGHSVVVIKSEGFNISTGKDKFMDGAEYAYEAFGDYVKGNGPHVVYSKMNLNGDTVFTKSEGKTKTTFSPKGKPITTVEGTVTFTKGTGMYEGIQGSGTYKGKFISSNIMVVEWEGEYFIKK
jgi:hypothetical protein